ncbi:MAG TPA: methyltransferase [Polyangiaceae bacterium]|nr:methyltransferase [Polyangiaceae bacterium]
MSSTKGGTSTSASLHFPTPDWAIDVILPELPIAQSEKIVDAGCGEGAILDRLKRATSSHQTLVGIELQPELANTAWKRFEGEERIVVLVDNFVHRAGEYDWLDGGADIVIGNPPFVHALDFIKCGRELVANRGGTVAMLLRLDWLAPNSDGRGAFLDAFPPDVHILDRRPQFRVGKDGNKGTDSCEYAWLTWRAGSGGRWKRLRCERPARSRKAA